MANPNSQNVGFSFIINFTPDEYDSLTALSKEFDFALTKDGIKDFILTGGEEASEMDSKETPSARVGNIIRNAINNNPELAETLAKDGIQVAKSIFKKKFGL